MTEHQIAPQIEYKTLDDFIEGQNNFHFHFLDDCDTGLLYRTAPHFKRFQDANPDLEKAITKAVVEAVRIARNESRQNLISNLPYDKLYEAYNLMSKLVFTDDTYVMHNGQPDCFFLCR